MKSFGGVSSQFLDFMNQGKQTHHLPRDDILKALTHRAYPAIVDILNALIGGKRRVQVFNCDIFLPSPCVDDYDRAVEEFKKLLIASFQALRLLVDPKKVPWNCETEILVRTTSCEDAFDAPVVTLARGQSKQGYDACVTGLPPIKHSYTAFLAKRNGNIVTCDKVLQPGTSKLSTVDHVILCALLARARDDLTIVMVQNDEDGEKVAKIATACDWNVARVLGNSKGETYVKNKTTIVWNTEARGWLTFESARVGNACMLNKQCCVTKCFALLYDRDGTKWVAKALGQIVGPLDERQKCLGVTFFR